MAKDTESTGDLKETPEETAAREEAEANPQPDNPEPEPISPYGKVVYYKNGAGSKGDEVEEADIVIEDMTVPIVVKSRNGLAGVIASPELIDYAEVIE